MILDLLRQRRERSGDRIFFHSEDRAYTYRATFDESLALAGRFQSHGIVPGDRLAVDLPNTAGFPLLLLAGAMLGVSFHLLNHRLTPAKKADLLAGHGIRMVIDDTALETIAGLPGAAVTPQDPDPDAVFVHMFTSGTSGIPKCARLTHRNVVSAARSSAETFLAPGEGVWQLALPLYHVGGLQVMMRSLVNGSAFVLYQRFDPAKLLDDVTRLGVTHISVVDRMLQELLAAAPEGVRSYRVILLGGGPPNWATLEAARGSNVYVSYGMTEASGTVSARTLDGFLDGPDPGGMELLPGYSARILEPDAGGQGEIALAGAGVFDGYETLRGPTAASPFTQDGFFRTGDRGCLQGDMLHVRERVSGMLISGGENVYPQEIEREIRAVPGVHDTAVIGVPSARWGRRPVAFVTGKASSAEVTARLEERLARFQQPDRLHVLDELPRTALGKLDRAALQELDEHRLEVVAVTIHRISQPLLAPFRTSRGEITQRESLIIEIADHLGRRGYAEGVAFSTPWYTEETVESTLEALTKHLVPTVLERAYLGPEEVFPSFSELPGALMAKGALEPAFWDLYGRITGTPLPELLAESAGAALVPTAAAGVSLGIMPIDDTLAEVTRYRAKGYRRVKLKIRPGDDVERVRAVREAHPDLMLMVDANRGYRADDIDVFRELDPLGLVCIEEPIACASIAELSAFQARIATPVCVDESISTETDLAEVLRHPGLRCINLKIGKFGGVLPSLLLYSTCMERGIDLWLGGMYETGVSKYLHAEFERLEGFTIPGDISESRRYFERDIVRPEVTVADGEIVLPGGPGLGIELDRERLDETLLERIEVVRGGV